MKRLRRTAAVIGCALLAAFSPAAWAQETASPTPPRSASSGWGVRVGLASDPDQIVGGVQFDLGEIADRVHFEPVLELGLGDDHTILAGTGAVWYDFGPQGQVRPYAGGGVTLGVIDRDKPAAADDTDFEIGLRALGGASWRLEGGREFFLELDLVFGDIHDAQIVAGWRF